MKTAADVTPTDAEQPKGPQMIRLLAKCTAFVIGTVLTIPCLAQPGNAIVHDGEFQFLRRQHGERWDAEDKEVEKMLADIRARQGGERPNILYILIDDVSFGQMGNRTMNYVTGIQTPNINGFAKEGLSLMRMYTEPSCTPTRAAMLTGRHPVRVGIKEVKVALVGEGLPANEVTIAEVLSKAGYATSHVGKWHQGDIEQAYPHNQGFDYAAFPLHQQVQLSLMTDEAADSYRLIGFADKTQSNEFALDKNFKPKGLVTGVEAVRGGTATEIDLRPGEKWTQAHYLRMNERYQRQTLEQIEELSKGDRPFFLQYWPLYPLNFVNDKEQHKSLNGGHFAEKLQELDGMLGEVFDKVDELGIAENTMVVVMADNGCMHLIDSYTSGLNELVYRGGKTDFLEGGVRVDAFVRWPAGIQGGSYAGDIIHVSDLFTTFARLGQATRYIPSDRVIDGIDQTALLLKGEHHGRRDYVYIYQNEILRAVVKQEFKMHLPAPGVPGAAAPVFNVLRDPREEQAYVGMPLWSGASFQDMVKRHMMMIAKYPHNKLGTGRPYDGIDNLRPESRETVETFTSWHRK
jgi:arylsulfatase